MMVTTKGKYALQILLDIAEQTKDDDTKVVSLKTIAERQNLSMKYLETIVAVLNKGGLVKSIRGKDGGYRLTRSANCIVISEVMALTEGSLAPVSCLNECKGGCSNADTCLTRPMWEHLDRIIDDYLSHITLNDLLLGKVS